MKKEAERGLGSKEYKASNYAGIKHIEAVGNERYILYMGRTHIYDHENNTLCRGHLKIGRSAKVTALMRGRNESGGDFRIYAELLFDNKADMERAEEIAKCVFTKQNITCSQGQREIFDIKDENIDAAIKDLVKHLNKNNIHTVGTKFYID